MDALRTAVTALNLEVGKLRIPRLGEGARAAPHVLVTARDMLAEERAKYVKAALRFLAW